VTNPNKRKGDDYERLVRDYATARGWLAEKTRAGYERDAGDVHLFGPAGMIAILQAKNWRTWCLPEWLRGLAEQKAQAKAPHAALVIKRRGVGDPALSYVVVTLADYLDLIEQAAYVQQHQLLDAERGI
jgi:hypothetical protein